MNNFSNFANDLFATKWVSNLTVKVREALVKKVMNLSNLVARREQMDDAKNWVKERKANADRIVVGIQQEQSRNELKKERQKLECGNQKPQNGKSLDQKSMDLKPQKQKPQNGKLDDVTEGIRNFLNRHYELRYNLLSEQTEYRPIGGQLDEFVPLDQRQVNTICIEIRREGVNCWDRDLNRYLNSAFIHEYHPFRLYMEELPAWDGKDRLRNLAERVSKSDYWVSAFHRWMLGMAAQWMDMEHLHANSVAPLLISGEQGWQKSTFCKSLIPKALMGYYTDQLNLASSAIEVQLSLMGLINLDEFDRISPKRMAQLKNLMQLSSLNIRKAYKKNFQRLPRIASFIGTSNRKDLLTDPTGSRRFICVEVDGPIDCKGLNMNQIYAQLKAELESGERFWFTHEEEREIQKHNTCFYRLMPEQEIFNIHFRSPREGEKFDLLSLADILEVLRKCHKGLLHSLDLAKFGSALIGAGVERIHTIEGNRYKVVRIK